jgi:hypothetical protein
VIVELASATVTIANYSILANEVGIKVPSDRELRWVLTVTGLRKHRIA